MSRYLYVKGAKSGAINGSVTQKGRENSSFVLSMDSKVAIPIDQMSGLSAGMRRHEPLTITKEIDQASPLLFNCCVTNENLTLVQIKFWKVGTMATGAQGSEEQYYTIELANAHVCEFRQFTPEHTGSESIAAKSTWDQEEIKFSFQKITLTWTKGGKTAVDDWEART